MSFRYINVNKYLSVLICKIQALHGQSAPLQDQRLSRLMENNLT